MSKSANFAFLIIRENVKLYLEKSNIQMKHYPE